MASSPQLPRSVRASSVIVSFLLLASLACSLSSLSSGENEPGATGVPGEAVEPGNVSSAVPSEKPNPLSVSVALDAETRATEVIPVSGGTLTATGSDGTRYTLVIPENALLSDQEIRMTPVSSIDGLPFGDGVVAAVDLKPEGLLLFAPATLTIDLPDNVSPSEFLGFSFLHEGEELFLYPSQVTESSVSIQLMHFSGYGGGSGSGQDASNMGKYPPSSGENQAMQAAASAVAKSGGQVPIDELTDILREWYETSVYPNLQAATTDDSKLESAGGEFSRWWRNLDGLGLESDFEKEIARAQNRFHEAMANAIKKTSERCRSQQDPINVRRLIRLAKIALEAQLLGSTYEQSETALDQAGNCAKFELHFTSRIENTSGCQRNFISQVKATVELNVSSGKEAFVAGFFKGSAPLEYVEFSPPSGCPEQQGVTMCPSQGTSKTNSTFSVTSGTLFNLNYSEEADSAPPEIMIEYDPGTPAEKMSVQCPDAEPVPDVFKLMEELGLGKVLLWRNAYEESHKDEGGGPFTATDWEYSGGALYARKVYQGKSGETPLGFSFVEDTTMDIFFKPGGGK